jgi:hypothetical protein
MSQRDKSFLWLPPDVRDDAAAIEEAIRRLELGTSQQFGSVESRRRLGPTRDALLLPGSFLAVRVVYTGDNRSKLVRFKEHKNIFLHFKQL